MMLPYAQGGGTLGRSHSAWTTDIYMGCSLGRPVLLQLHHAISSLCSALISGYLRAYTQHHKWKLYSNSSQLGCGLFTIVCTQKPDPIKMGRYFLPSHGLMLTNIRCYLKPLFCKYALVTFVQCPLIKARFEALTAVTSINGRECRTLFFQEIIWGSEKSQEILKSLWHLPWLPGF